MDWSSVMRTASSLCSCRILPCSREVRRCRRMSRMAFACSSESLYAVRNDAWAVSADALALMSFTTASMSSSAMRSPSRMWERSLALVRSNWVRFATMSLRCST